MFEKRVGNLFTSGSFVAFETQCAAYSVLSLTYYVRFTFCQVSFEQPILL